MEHCTKCKCEIHGFLTGRKHISNKVYCRDCYYNALGAVMEQHPIGMMPSFDPSTFLVIPSTAPSALEPIHEAIVTNNNKKTQPPTAPAKVSRFESIID